MNNLQNKVLVKSKFLINIPLNNKYIIYHSIYGRPILVSKSALSLLSTFQKGKNCNKIKDLNEKKNILMLKKRAFLVEPGKNEREQQYDDIDKRIELVNNGPIKKRHLRIEITNDCNCACKHCYLPKILDSKNISKNINFPIVKTAIDKFMIISKKYGAESILISFFGGEPLLNWKVLRSSIEYINTVKRVYNNIDIKCGFNSNGLLLNDNIINFLKKYNVSIGLSLDGFKEHNDKFRVTKSGKGTFDIITRNLDKLLEKKIVFVIETCVNDYNYNTLEDFVDFLFNKYHIKSIALELLSHNEGCDFNKRSWQEKADKIINIKKKYMDINKKMVVANQYLKTLFSVFDNYLIANCSQLGTGIYVNASGNVQLCQKSIENLGNVKDIEKILKSDYYKTIAVRDLRKIQGCQGCEIEGFCAGFCAGIVYYYTKDIFNTNNHNFRKYCDISKYIFRKMMQIIFSGNCFG